MDRPGASGPITSPADPRVAAVAAEVVTGADQIPALLGASPRERLQLLTDAVAFEERAHRARRLPPSR